MPYADSLAGQWGSCDGKFNQTIYDGNENTAVTFSNNSVDVDFPVSDVRLIVYDLWPLIYADSILYLASGGLTIAAIHRFHLSLFMSITSVAGISSQLPVYRRLINADYTRNSSLA